MTHKLEQPIWANADSSCTHDSYPGLSKHKEDKLQVEGTSCRNVKKTCATSNLLQTHK